MSATILIVDDEGDLRDAIAFDFKRRNFNVLTAGSGREAFQIVESQPVDVVVSDVRMADGDGVELLEKIKARNVHRPMVIFVTGFADISLEVAFDKGADAVFIKPFDRKALFEAVNRGLHPQEKPLARASTRVNAPLAITVKFLESGFTAESRTNNLGRGGLFVELAEKQHPETLEKAEFCITSNLTPEWIIMGEGVVRWVRKSAVEGMPPGCGIEFMSFAQDDRQRMMELVNHLKTKPFIPRS